jgi:hypothetical protein
MGKTAVRLVRRIGKNGSRSWVGVEEGDEIKKYRLTVGNLTKIAKGIYKKVSNVQNLIFKQNLIEFK